MANFYIQPQNEPTILYELHSTTAVTATFSSELTTYPVESGAVVTENIVMKPATVSFNGILTDVKQNAGFSPITLFSNLLTEAEGTPNKLSEYIEDLRRRQFNKELFFVYFSGVNAELSDIETAVITTLSISKDPSIGTSWQVSLDMQEVRLADPALTEAIPSDDFHDLLAANAGSGANPSGVDGNQKEKWREGLFTKVSPDRTKIALID